MKTPIGKKIWAIAEGYIPSWTYGREPEFSSHESACILNTNEQDANVEITLYFSDRDPAGPYEIIIPAQRTIHVRFNDLKYPEPVPKGIDYASTIVSDVPVVVQYTRFDSRQSENPLLSTIAYAE